MFIDFKMKLKTGVAQHICYLSSIGGRQIRRRRTSLLWASIAPATKICRVKHWRCYQDYCKKYHLNLFPRSLVQAADYLSFLSIYMKLSSVLVYYQSVRFYQNYSGYMLPLYPIPILKLFWQGYRIYLVLFLCLRTPSPQLT